MADGNIDEFPQERRDLFTVGLIDALSFNYTQAVRFFTFPIGGALSDRHEVTADQILMLLWQDGRMNASHNQSMKIYGEIKMPTSMDARLLKEKMWYDWATPEAATEFLRNYTDMRIITVPEFYRAVSSSSSSSSSRGREGDRRAGGGGSGKSAALSRPFLALPKPCRCSTVAITSRDT